jgi:hypothetical protein
MACINSPDFANFSEIIFAAAEPYNGEPCLYETYPQVLLQEQQKLTLEKQQQPSSFNSKMSIINQVVSNTKKPTPVLNLSNNSLLLRRLANKKVVEEI